MAKLALVVAALIMAFGGTASAATYESEPAFCQQTILHDYLAALDRLPEASELPPGGQLDFTSAKVSLRPTAQLLVGGGAIGFKLNRARELPAIHPGWTLVYHLSRTDWHGFEVLAIDRGKRKIRSLGRGKGAGMSFEVGPKPSPYRLLLRFRARDGRRLASYSFRFRVVAPVKDTRLALDASAYRPEETVFAQIQNFGTASVGYGLGYWVERFNGSGWEEAPENPRNPVPAIALLLGAGQASKCEGFWIPPTTAPGRYRISRASLSAEFDVLP